MGTIYAMQRANGDWFALETRTELRVPVFTSNSQAMQVRAFNVEMLVFKPVPVDERALKDLVPAEGDRPACFWLVDKGASNMKRGVALKFAEFAQLVRGG